MVTNERVVVCVTHRPDVEQDVVGVAASLASAMAARLELVHVAEPGRGSEGDELRTISEAAAAPHVELVVVPSASPTGSSFARRGVADRLVQSLRAPLLLVRDAPQLRAWLAGGRLAVAALVADDAASDHVIDWLRRLRRVRPCDVSVLQAYYPDDEARRYGVRARSMVAAEPEVEDLMRRDLRRHLGELGGEGELELHPVLSLGRQVDHLLDHPAAQRAGLLVVGSHRTRGLARWASVAAGVVHFAERSVLVVPADAPASAEPAWPVLQRVLVATDFSSFAAPAIRHAYGLAACSGGDVLLVHATAPRPDPSTLAAERAALQALVPASPPDGVLSHVEVVVGHDAAEAIVHAAARLGADCIVIASHGRTGVRKVLLGSIAQAVVQRSSCPVLVVRPPPDA